MSNKLLYFIYIFALLILQSTTCNADITAEMIDDVLKLLILIPIFVLNITLLLARIIRGKISLYWLLVIFSIVNMLLSVPLLQHQLNDNAKGVWVPFFIICVFTFSVSLLICIVDLIKRFK